MTGCRGRSAAVPRWLGALAFFGASLWGESAFAGFTETLPEGTALVDVGFNQSWLHGRYDNDGEFGPLLDELYRYEPGGGLQGVITPNVEARYSVLVPRLQLGLIDELSIGIGIPIVLNTTVEPDLEWQPGDYQWALGRRYSDQDFWEWAASMGQDKPGDWSGNNGVLGDIVLGARLRWTDWIDAFQEIGLPSSLSIFYGLPTGTPADPEEVVAAGTTMWELQTQGDLGFHLGIDKTFEEHLDGRLRIGVDGFYEVFFPRTYDTPRGINHPLLLNFEPYVGESYEVAPGDYSGFSVQIDGVPYRGPARGTWITGGDAEKAEDLPPILSLFARYTYTHLQQSDWTSDSPLWDWDQEELWLPGYRQILTAQVSVGLLRLGVPLIVYGGVRTASLLPGKNARVADVLQVGLKAPAPLW